MLKFMNFMMLGIMTHMQYYSYGELLKLLESKKNYLVSKSFYVIVAIVLRLSYVFRHLG